MNVQMPFAIGFGFLLPLPLVDGTAYSKGIYGHLYVTGSVLSVQLWEAVIFMELCLFILTLRPPRHSSCYNGGLI